MTNTNEIYNEETAKVIGMVISSFLDEQAQLVEKYRVVIAEKFLQQELQPQEMVEIAEKLGLQITMEDVHLYNAAHGIESDDVEEGEKDLEQDLQLEERVKEEAPTPEEIQANQEKIDAEQEAELEEKLKAELEEEDEDDEFEPYEEPTNEDSNEEEEGYQLSPEQDKMLTDLFENFRASLSDPALKFPLEGHDIANLESNLFESGLFPVYSAYFTPQGLQFVLTPAIIQEGAEVEDYEHYKYTFSGTTMDLDLPAQRFEFLFGMNGIPEGILLRNTKNDREAILLGVEEEEFDEVRLYLSEPETGKYRNWKLKNIVGAGVSSDLLEAMQQVVESEGLQGEHPMPEL